MSNMFFLKRIFTNRAYWLSVMAAILLLLCSVIYRDPYTGKKYIFLTLFYDSVVKEALASGWISLKSMILGYDTSYLWMFCPIIAGIPCVLNNKIERFALFRIGKNRYLFSKYFSNLLASGCILLISYIMYAGICMLFTNEDLWDILLFKKLLSVFFLGAISSVSSIILSEFVHNKYLILCIPFVLNYFMYIFLGNIIPHEIWQYLTPSAYQILFLWDKEMMIRGMMIVAFLIAGCAFFEKLAMERRYDCGQK